MFAFLKEEEALEGKHFGKWNQEGIFRKSAGIICKYLLPVRFKAARCPLPPKKKETKKKTQGWM